jgi:hypothetical protein
LALWEMAANMPEGGINIFDALRGQQEQLKRLIAQRTWISDAPHTTLSDIKAQVRELKRLLGQLESDIRDQLTERRGTQRREQRSPNAVAKAHNLADEEINKLTDQSATPEEQRERKQHLLKDPKEFRDIRGRKPKS